MIVGIKDIYIRISRLADRFKYRIIIWLNLLLYSIASKNRVNIKKNLKGHYKILPNTLSMKCLPLIISNTNGK